LVLWRKWKMCECFFWWHWYLSFNLWFDWGIQTYGVFCDLMEAIIFWQHQNMKKMF
jgi:hypothetical protein